MSLADDFAEGLYRSAERLEEAYAAIEKHEEALLREKEIVSRFYNSLILQLPMHELANRNIHADQSNWAQILFVYNGPFDRLPSKKKLHVVAGSNHVEEATALVATLGFDTLTLQFHYSDFMSGFQRRLPIPPNMSSYPLIAQHLGESLGWWLAAPRDRDRKTAFDDGLRETLRCIGNGPSTP